MQVILSRDTLKAALLFAGKMDIRQCLNGICIEERGGKVYLLASDGHRALRVDVTNSAEDISAGFQAILPRDAVEVMAKAKRDVECIRFDTLPDSTRVRATLSDGTSFLCIDERFPDVDRVIVPGNVNHPGLFNFDYLRDLLKAAKLLGVVGKGILALRLKGDGKPGTAGYIAFGDSVEMVVMPVRE